MSFVPKSKLKHMMFLLNLEQVTALFKLGLKSKDFTGPTLKPKLFHGVALISCTVLP
jgi:hypothetical protein